MFSTNTCALTGTGTCSVTVTGTTAGGVTLRTTYAGDTENAGSFSKQTIVVTSAVGGALSEQTGEASRSTVSANPTAFVALVALAPAIEVTEQVRPNSRNGDVSWDE